MLFLLLPFWLLCPYSWMSLFCLCQHCSQCYTALPNVASFEQRRDISWLFYTINLKLWASIWKYLGPWLRSVLHGNCSKSWYLCMLKRRAQTKIYKNDSNLYPLKWNYLMQKYTYFLCDTLQGNHFLFFRIELLNVLKK